MSEKPIKRSHFKISFIIPSAITLAGTASALTGMKVAIDGDFVLATIYIIMAAIFDGLDGRAARMLKASSTFGEILDSLSDFVAFGVAPAFIMYFWVLSNFGGLGWAITLFFSISCALRLARFNSMLDSQPEYASNYFQGIPAPAGALVALLPLMLSFNDIALPSYVVAAWMVAVALLMVSIVPMFSFKKTKIPAAGVLPIMALVGLILAGMAGRPWLTLSLLLIVYLCSIPFSYMQYKKIKKKHV